MVRLGEMEQQARVCSEVCHDQDQEQDLDVPHTRPCAIHNGLVTACPAHGETKSLYIQHFEEKKDWRVGRVLNPNVKIKIIL